MILLTSIYAAPLIFLLLFITVSTVRLRRNTQTALGDGQNLALLRHIRAQGNLTEYAPIFLISLGYCEMNGISEVMVHVLGSMFVTGRLLHAFSLLKHEQYDAQGKITALPRFRIAGMLCTIFPLFCVALLLIWQFVIVMQQNT